MTDTGQKTNRVRAGGPVFASLMAALFMLLGAPASAVTVSGLYSADVPVSGSSSEALRQGYADGLRQVMVRVSGSQDVLDMEGVDEVLQGAESLLLAYQVGSDSGQDRMQMSFGAVGVNKALASLGAPVWGANRPLTLAWVAVENRGERTLLTRSGSEGAGSGEEWRKAFQAAAEVRGLPLAFPPASAGQDRALMSDLWGQFIGRIQEASEDVSHDVLTLVRVSRSGGQWRAGWVAEGMGMDAAERSVTAGSPEELARAVVNNWAEQYASRYAVAAGDVGDLPRVDIVLEGVTTLADYGQIKKVLESLTPVESVGANRVRGDRLTAQVTFTGELDQLKEYIALDPRFVAQAGQPEEPAAEDSQESTDTAGAGDDASDGEPGGESGSETAQGELSVEDSGLDYQPLAEGDEQDAEQAFESLYQVLYYRWQPGTVVSGGEGG